MSYTRLRRLKPGARFTLMGEAFEVARVGSSTCKVKALRAETVELPGGQTFQRFRAYEWAPDTVVFEVML